MFNQLAKHQVNVSKLPTFDLPEIGEGAGIVVAMAGESNVEYFRAVLKQAPSDKGARKKKKNEVAEINPAEVKKQRGIDRNMFGKHVVKGFTKIIDDKAVTVVFNEENAIVLMNALPDWLFDELRAYCTNVSNFTDFEIDVEDKVKN